MLQKLTATNLTQETIENMEHMAESVERMRLEAEEAKREYERKLHDYMTQKELYNLLVKSLNHNCNK